jgi:DNA-binding SARP family transcriptional activator
MGLKLHLFGHFTAHADGMPVEFLYKGRNGVILAYLLLRQESPPKDTEIADLFWSDYTDPDACLRSWCRRLREAVAGRIDVKTIGGAVHLLLREAEADLTSFDALLAEGEQGRIAALKQAVNLFRRGPLLAGVDDAWAEEARKVRAARVLDALSTLADDAVTEGRHADARKYHAARVQSLLERLRTTPRQEASWCDLMEAMIAAGERLEAAEIYRRCQDYFQQRQLSPPARMTDLSRQLQSASALKVPGAEPPSANAPEAESLGGAVPPGSPFYIARAADAELAAAIARRDSIISLRGPGRIGKTSLLARGLEQARQAGARVILTDFRKFSASELQTLDACCLALAQSLTDQLDLAVSPCDGWHPDRAPGDNFERFVRREALKKLATPLVWGLDEVDRLFPYAYKDDIFGRFRAWHNERALDPAGPWQQLTLALTYATESYLLIADLNRRYGAPLHSAAEIERFYRLVGGHPSLVRRGLQEMRTQHLDIAALEMASEEETGPYAGHLEQLFVFLTLDADASQASLTEAVLCVLRGAPCPSPRSFARLWSAGVVAGTSAQNATLRCNLYANFLRKRLL